MAHKELLGLFPKDIVDYCMTPFLGVSEETVRQNHKKVMAELEKGSINYKGNGTFYIVNGMRMWNFMTGTLCQDFPPMEPELEKLLRQNMDWSNDSHLMERRELVDKYGFTFAELEGLDTGHMLYLQRCKSQSLWSGTPEIVGNDDDDIFPVGPTIPPHDIAIKPKWKHIAWVVGISNGIRICRRVHLPDTLIFQDHLKVVVKRGFPFTYMSILQEWKRMNTIKPLVW